MGQNALKRTLKGLEEAFEELIGQLTDFFPNSSTRTTARSYLRGLLGTVERKNSWQLAEGRDSQRLIEFNIYWDGLFGKLMQLGISISIG